MESCRFSRIRASVRGVYLAGQPESASKTREMTVSMMAQVGASLAMTTQGDVVFDPTNM